MLEEDDVFWAEYKNRSFEKGYILGRTISSIDMFKRGIRQMKRAYRTVDLLSPKGKDCCHTIRKYLLNETYSADLEKYLSKCP